jgi:hypothetical protein
MPMSSGDLENRYVSRMESLQQGNKKREQACE